MLNTEAVAVGSEIHTQQTHTPWTERRIVEFKRGSTHINHWALNN
jgi:hypothetical protein